VSAEAAAGCIFCMIVAGDAPARVVHEGDRTLAFLDINPATRGHTLVIPRTHCTDLLDADPTDLAEVVEVAQRIARAAVNDLGAAGVNLIQSSGLPRSRRCSTCTSTSCLGTPTTGSCCRGSPPPATPRKWTRPRPTSEPPWADSLAGVSR
jgi:hypothetical protein